METKKCVKSETDSTNYTWVIAILFEQGLFKI